MYSKPQRDFERNIESQRESNFIADPEFVVPSSSTDELGKALEKVNSSYHLDQKVHSPTIIDLILFLMSFLSNFLSTITRNLDPFYGISASL